MVESDTVRVAVYARVSSEQQTQQKTIDSQVEALAEHVIENGFIVYDEIVGFLVAMYMRQVEWRWIVAGFIVFRVFDIWKPYPISSAEDELGLGLAIMADDILAGLYTLAILYLARLALQRFTD